MGKPAKTDPGDDRFQTLDDPHEWEAFSRPSAAGQQQWESSIAIQGMHCAGCALTLEAALQAVSGVVRAEVNAASGRANVVWRADVSKPSEWMAAVRRAGYSPLPAADALGAAQQRKEQRAALWRWLVAGLCMMQVMMYSWPLYVAEPGDLTANEAQLLRWACWVLTLPVVLFSCTPFFSAALRDLAQRRIGMDLPVALGMAITFAVSSAGTFDPNGPLGAEVYFDSLTMFAFFLLSARWIEARLRNRTAGALEALMNRLPDTVLRRTASTGPLALAAHGNDDGFERVAVRRLRVGDVIRVLPGEAFPADGAVQGGRTTVDEALLTGESRPLARDHGSAVIAGSYNLTAAVDVRIERHGTDTRFAQIVMLMQQAATEKPPLARLADRIAQPFLLAVLGAAAIALAWWWPAGPGQALMVATAVLIVTCPCALSLATPAALLAAAGSLARRGVLVRRLAALEALADVDTIVFDKTGTLTSDRMALVAITTRDGVAADEALARGAALARESRHPVARSLVEAARERVVAATDDDGPQLEPWRAQAVEELAGRGVRGEVACASDPSSSALLRLGSHRFCGMEEGAFSPGVTQSHLADEAGWIASFDFAEAVRADVAQAVESLKQAGIALEILSGDSEASVRDVARQAGIERFRGECSPRDKLQHVLALQGAGRKVAMVGDGLNDAPVLAAAQSSFALGHALPLAQAQADFVVPGKRIAVVAQSILFARRAMRVVRQNLLWAVGYNAICIPLAIAGYMPAWLAGLGMACSSLLVVANAARLSLETPAITGPG